jgi:hypothetical protein
MYWQPDTGDPLHLHLTTWRFDGHMLLPAGDSELLIDGVAPAAYPPSGLDELCGSPSNRSVDFPAYVTREPTPTPVAAGTDDDFGFGFSVPMCRIQPFGPGDADGDGTDDTAFVGVLATKVGGCPEPGHEDYLFGIDLDGDRLVDVEDDHLGCEAWCSGFALVDLSGDGKVEILVNEGHTAPPASAVIAVYELAPSASTDPYLEPVRFPDGTNRFLLVNSYQGYYGAYCRIGNDLFVTWEVLEEGVGGVVPSITFREYRMVPWEFQLQDETTIEAPDAEFPTKDRRGYLGTFCGVEAPTPG